MPTSSSEKITSKDLEDKFREVHTEMNAVSNQVQSYAITFGAVIVVLLVLLAFLLGRRKGKKNQSIIEIRRV